MRFAHLFLSGVLTYAACSEAKAALLYYDSFNYGPSDTSLGTAGSPNWVKNGTSPDPIVRSIGGLTYPGLQVSSDTVSLQYDGSGVNAGSGAPAGTDGHAISAGITNGSVYYSLLLKVTAVQTTGGNGFATGANLTQGSFMAGLETVAASGAPTVGSTAAPLLILTGDGTQFATTYRLGTSKTATSADRQFAAQTFTTGPSAETVFVVLKYTFDSVNGDSASLFLNPTPGAPEPTASLTVTAGTSLTLGTPAGIKSFFVRNNSVEPDALLIDELRIGDTWADVTPAGNPLKITGVARQGNDVQITWTMAAGTTNTVQLAVGDPSNANFSDLSPQIVGSGSGTISTNYVDVGGATSSTAHFYRIHLVQ